MQLNLAVPTVALAQSMASLEALLISNWRGSTTCDSPQGRFAEATQVTVRDQAFRVATLEELEHTVIQAAQT
jgi:hypothetical protein